MREHPQGQIIAAALRAARALAGLALFALFAVSCAPTPPATTATGVICGHVPAGSGVYFYGVDPDGNGSAEHEVKIGMSRTDMSDRGDEDNTWNPYPLIPVGYLPTSGTTALDEETAAHARYADQHVRLEWYALEGRLAEDLEPCLGGN